MIESGETNMTNITTANNLSTSPLAAQTPPGNSTASAPDGTSFGAVLARQVVDNAPAIGAAPAATPAPEKDAPVNHTTVPGKGTDNKTTALQNSPADLTGNMIALLQPLQKGTPLSTKNIPSDKTAATSKVQNDKGTLAQHLPIDLPGNVIALPTPLQEAGTPVTKDIRPGKSTTPGKIQGDKHPATQNIPADLSGTLIALPQAVQEIRTPAAPTSPNSAEVLKGAASKPVTPSLLAQPNEPGIAKDIPVSTTGKTGSATPLVQPAHIPNLSATAANQPALPQAQDLALLHTANLPNTPPPAAPGNTTPAQQSIYSALGSSGWANEFSQKISWMSTGQNNQIAELHLNPPDLGPLNVVLTMSDNQATAAFTSPHSAVRDAVENAMPKLREILADNGITLGNTTVSDQPQRDGNPGAFSGQQSPQQGGRWTTQSSAQAEIPAQPVLPRRTVQRHDGMVDTFA
ncbi:MAG: hypothetical protein GJU76_05390 [Gallionella sp.]|jgi:flagellar hook-length control protein FliK|nr:hypothetical protein [Gallionella sp.]